MPLLDYAVKQSVEQILSFALRIFFKTPTSQTSSAGQVADISNFSMQKCAVSWLLYFASLFTHWPIFAIRNVKSPQRISFRLANA
jgi:hypothetical protein